MKIEELYDIRSHRVRFVKGSNHRNRVSTACAYRELDTAGSLVACKKCSLLFTSKLVQL